MSRMASKCLTLVDGPSELLLVLLRKSLTEYVSSLMTIANIVFLQENRALRSVIVQLGSWQLIGRVHAHQRGSLLQNASRRNRR